MSRILNLKSGQRCKAFTLIEIMVATVIMVILVGLVIQITSEVLKVWNRSSGKLAANAEARIAMDLITQDLETARFIDNGQQWLRVESPLDPAGEYTDQTVALKLFSPALDRDQLVAGDLCAIAYRLMYKESYQGANDKVYGLYRQVIEPDQTFNELIGSPSDSSSPQLSLDGSLWSENSITAEENYLAGNIVEFKVILYEDDGSGTANPVNWSESSYQVSGNHAYGGSGATLITNPLLYADVMLTVVSDTGLDLLRSLDEGQAGTGYTNGEDVVREHGEVFTRRVNFITHPR
ncbi:MAG: PilW family protein [Opitutaceae bacterium]